MKRSRERLTGEPIMYRTSSRDQSVHVRVEVRSVPEGLNHRYHSRAESKLAFTAETLPAHHLVVTRKPHRAIGTLEQFREETVGTVQGTS